MHVGWEFTSIHKNGTQLNMAATVLHLYAARPDWLIIDKVDGQGKIPIGLFITYFSSMFLCLLVLQLMKVLLHIKIGNRLVIRICYVNKILGL